MILKQFKKLLVLAFGLCIPMLTFSTSAIGQDTTKTDNIKKAVSAPEKAKQHEKPAVKKIVQKPKINKIQIKEIRQFSISAPNSDKFKSVNVKITTSDSMDQGSNLNVSFGSKAPFNQYKLTGKWKNHNTWEGKIPYSKVGASGNKMRYALSGGKSIQGQKVVGKKQNDFVLSNAYNYYSVLNKYENKKYKQALAAFNQLLKSKINGRSLLLHGRILYMLNKKKESRVVLEKALVADPLLDEAYYLLGEIALKNKKPQVAEDYFTQSLKLRSVKDNFSPLQMSNSGTSEPLSADFIKSSSFSSQKDKFTQLLGIAQAKKGNWGKSIEHFTGLIKSNDESAINHFNLGTVYLLIGKSDKAEKEFYRAMDLDESLQYVRLNLGVLYLMQDSLSLAQKEFNTIQNAQYKNHAFLNKQLIDVENGNSKKALEIYKKSLTGLGKDYRIGLNYADLIYELKSDSGSTKNATAVLEKIIKSGENSPKVFYLTGKYYLRIKDTKNAEQMFKKALLADPLYADACFSLGLIQQNAGNYEESQIWYFRALERDKYFAEAHAKLGFIYSKLGMKDKELASYSKASKARKARAAGGKITVGVGKSVAITSFDNTSKSKEYAWLKVGIAEAMSSDLKSLSSLNIVERLKIEKMMMEQALSATDMVGDKVQEMGKITGAELIITGSYQIIGQEIKIVSRVLDVSSGEVLTTADARGKLDDIFDLERKLSLNLLSEMGVTINQKEKKQLKERHKASLEALRFLSEGRTSYYNGDLEGSLVKMRQAVELNSDFIEELGDMDLQSAEDKMEKTLAVLEFGNSTGDTKYDWMQGGIAEALTTDMKKVTGLYLVERLDLNAAMMEINLGMTDIVDAKPCSTYGNTHFN